MDKNSKILILIFTGIVVISVTVLYKRYIISEDIVYYTNEELFKEALMEE